MAAKSLSDRLNAVGGKLRSSIPFLKAKVPGGGRAEEPFDSIEDSSTLGMDDFEPNAAPDLMPASALQSRSKPGMAEILHGLWEAILQSKVMMGLIIAVLAFLLALAVVAYIVASPPAAPKKPGSSPAATQVSPEGEALLQRLILPPLPNNAPRIELERETSRVYTERDLADFRTEPGSVDISGLKASYEADLDALYRTVP